MIKNSGCILTILVGLFLVVTGCHQVFNFHSEKLEWDNYRQSVFRFYRSANISIDRDNRIKDYKKIWESRAICSSFALKTPGKGTYIVTAAHCASLQKKGYRYYIEKSKKNFVRINFVNIGTPEVAEGSGVYDQDKGNDWALFYTKKEIKGLPYTNVRPDNQDKVYYAGFPNLQPLHITSGEVVKESIYFKTFSKRRKWGRFKGEHIATTLEIEIGMSGGPVFNKYGEVVGIGIIISTRGSFAYATPITKLLNNSKISVK